MLRGESAYAAARGDRILARKGAFDGPDGSFRFAHELAHLLQQNATSLPAGSPEQAEGDADRFAHGATRGRSAAIAVATPNAWAFDKRRVPPDDRVVSIVIVGRRATITIRAADGGDYTISPSVNHNLPARDEPYTIINGTFIAELAKQKRVYFRFSFRAGVPGFGPEHFLREVPLIVKIGGKAFSGGGGKKGTKKAKPGGAGTAAGPKGTTGTGRTDKPSPGKAPGEGGKGAPAPAGVKGGKGEEGTAVEGAIQGEVTDKVPVVTVKDAKQIEELKKRGLIPARTADEIKAKLDRKETLSFEEAITLVDALNQFVQGDADETARKDARESWLKWAKFIEENKENLSGGVKAGTDGITVQEVKQILAKHKKFIGVKDAPQRTTKKALYDPELRKSWNSLADWEKDLWKNYVEKYGNTADVTDASSKDLRITKAVRFSMALRMSPQFMKPGAREAAQQLFNDPIFIGATMAGIAAYLALWLVPEPVFSKAAAVMTTLALLSLISFSVMEIKNLASAWMRLSDESAVATTLEELEEAAEHFGKSIGGSGLRILVALATVLAGKLLPAPKAAPPATGGGGMAAAGAGGGTVVVPQARAVPTIKVLKDGTVVILGPGSGVAMSSTQGGGTGGPKPKSGGTQKQPAKKAESKEDARRRELAEAMAEDIGRGKRPEVPEGTEAKPSANPRTAALQPEVVLRNAMERSGIRVPEGHDAHHMVPKKGGGSWGERARAVLRRVGIGINEADNGVPLPRTTTDPATVPEAYTRHQTVHTEKYYRTLARRLEKAEPSEERIRALLRAIRVEITEGEFPH
jgi:hypothetical protein